MDDRSGAASHVGPGCALGAVVGGAAGFVAIRQVLVAWAECDVGINASANLYYLVFVVWPPLALLNAVVITAAYAAAARRAGRWAALGVALLAAVLLAVVAAVALPGLLTPDDYPLTCA